MNTDRNIEDWLAEVDDLIIRRELQADRIAALLERLTEAGVKRPSMIEARDRVDEALARLMNKRMSLMARL